MQTKTRKHPVILSILLALIPVVFMSAAGTAIAITEASDENSLIFQGIAAGLSALVGLLLVKALKHPYSEVGFSPLRRGSFKTVLFCIPFIAIEMASIVLMPTNILNGTRLAIIIVFTLLVGLNEELFFRGLMLRVLQQIGVKKAIIISSVIFGAGHAATALSGVSPQYVVLQIVFAFLFGFVAAEFAMITKSILPMIAWHFVHDLIGFIVGGVGEVVEGKDFIILIVQTIILLATAILYWRKSTAQAEV
ncbi:hypothetical protein AGMMS49992_09430 [Clostridia bacterium]|nr:hypothetical protein AGMMS49992_09430 [Clostridia bacterium]